MAARKKKAKRHPANKLVSASAVLWGRTSVSTTPVEIWLDPELETIGATTCGDKVATIVINASVQDDALGFDETLMHEAIHVCEIQFADELYYTRADANCTQAAVVFGRELTRFLRQLRQVGK